MKTNKLLLTWAALLSVAFTLQLHAQTTAFTYQGRLTDGGNPASGNYDLRFAIYDLATGGSALAGPITNSLAPVSNGLFTVALDFGPGAFAGGDRWLEIGAVTNGGGAFTTLSPRQQITPTPYAIQAASAMTVDLGAISNPTFIGTTTSTPLELQVNNQVGLRLEFPTAGTVPNLVGGDSGNSVGAGTQGAVIAGGGSTGNVNAIGDDSDFSAIGGGFDNTIAGNSFYATITGGSGNDIGVNAYYSAIGGGAINSIASNSFAATIAGGLFNTIGLDAFYSAIGGGWDNTIADGSTSSTIAGGQQNDIGVNADYSAVGGGNNNNIASNSVYGTIAGGRFNDIGVGAFYSAIGGGNNNNIGVDAPYSAISGGLGNNIGSNSFSATIAGGQSNEIGVNAGASSIGGGGENNIASNSIYGTIAGGNLNDIGVNADYSTIGGGRDNNIADNSGTATIAGGIVNDIGVNAAYSAIGGGWENNIESNSFSATIAGGFFNDVGVNANSSAVGGGFDNNIADNALYSVIPGGRANDVGTGASYALAAGRRAQANHQGSFVWADSQDADFASTANNQLLIRASGGVGIGETAPKSLLHVRDGSSGTPSVSPNAVAVFERSSLAYLVVLTPNNNESGLLFGNPTHSADGGVIFHSSNVPRGLEFRTGGNNAKMVIQSGGNVGIGTTSPSQKLHVVGNILATGTITPSSDRNVKKNFDPVDSLSVLERVASLPIQHWTYQTEDDAIRHVGPMAQDFHAAFGVGANDTTIATVDADGVALAAIQGLNQKVEVASQRSEVRIQKLEEELKRRNAQITELKRELAELKNIVGRLAKQ